MKLLVRDFVASLRERGELDVILPDLLSALGLNVLTRPGQGNRQYGVDVAAVGSLEGSDTTLFLFTIKPGDLTRNEWDSVPQGVRASLNEIRDVYLRAHVAPEYAALPIRIVLCVGGELREQVLINWTGYQSDNQTDQRAYMLWNGDKIAELILTGVLGPELLPEEARRSFQKAVALTDEPEVSFGHFCNVLEKLRVVAVHDPSQRQLITHRITIALWILYVWGRLNDNVEAAFLASERTVLIFWDMIKGDLSANARPDPRVGSALLQALNLNLVIFKNFYDTKAAPFVSVKQALAMAIRTRSSVDVNLALFQLAGRLALFVIWRFWQLERLGDDPEVQEAKSELIAEIGALSSQLIELIQCNEALDMPVSDEQVVEIGLVVSALLRTGDHFHFLRAWFSRMTMRLWFSGTRQTGFPTSRHEYREVLASNRKLADEDFRLATKGSTIVPLIAAWAEAFGNEEDLGRLHQLVERKLGHSTMQAWLFGPDSEEHLYRNSEEHGIALTDLPVREPSSEILEILRRAADDTNAHLESLSAVSSGYWPVVLLACRHWRLPVPIQFWIDAISPTSGILPTD